uniref:PP1-binding domain-containing protein n=1 Tax=Astyanax mexicanus TaxID=7994 RepID=A0A8B9HY35_ASTMX
MDSVETVGSRTPLGVLTPSQQNSEAGDADFSKLTPSHFGISTDSFITFKEKDKSRVGQLKSRRRSTIGVRGSPETNSLIRFRAKEVLKTPPRTPQMLENPLFSGCDSIKQKMAAFQRLMGEDEEDGEESVAPETEEKKNERVGGDSTGDAQNGQFQSTVFLCLSFKSPAPVLVLGSDSQSQLMSLPMLSKPEVSSVSKKKRVRFGAPLSPEFFDKTLPPSTPLQKGATPLRPPSSTGRKHSLLKTPQRFEPPLPQPDFYSPKDNGASPEFRIPRSRRDEEEDGDEVFLYGEKTASAKRRFGSKEVDRSLYGKRDYASKNPLLSPIIETTPTSLPNTPTPPSLPHTGKIHTVQHHHHYHTQSRSTLSNTQHHHHYHTQSRSTLSNTPTPPSLPHTGKIHTVQHHHHYHTQSRSTLSNTPTSPSLPHTGKIHTVQHPDITITTAHRQDPHCPTTQHHHHYHTQARSTLSNTQHHHHYHRKKRENKRKKRQKQEKARGQKKEGT